MARSVVTIDGPAGSGKSTTARAVAEALGWRYLDSGALYRALTFALLEAGVAPERWPELERGDLDGLGLRVEPGGPEGEGVRLRLGDRTLGEELRTERVTGRVSELARLPVVRAWLLDAQRVAGRDGRLVADGRDMGSVVFPDAAAKVYLEADPAERARRRLGDKGVEAPDREALDRETERLRRRDRGDMERELSPLRVPDDALVLDTTGLAFEEQVDRIVSYARERTGRDLDRASGPA